MYRPSAFAVDDVAKLHAYIRERGFATVALIAGGSIELAYAPVVLDSQVEPNGALRFHLARNNPVSQRADGAHLLFSFVGPDTYISPDWYATPGMVPTWNYIAVEAHGIARKLDRGEMQRLLVDVSGEHERKLAPKKPWTIDKVPEQRMSVLLNAIDGFEVRLQSLRGKFKLSQNVKTEDFEGTLRGLDARADAASAAIASAMRSTTAP
jgi:transcriptional regulator